MVTANRMQLARRAVQCFSQQSYPNKELVILDDGEQDYEPILRDIPSDQLNYIQIQKNPDTVLGALRNITLSEARGEILIQWDDDDWYHPERITRQLSVLQQGVDACCLSGSLMHIDNPDFFHLPYVGFLPDGIPGSIMHRRDDSIRYPEFRRSEDTVYLKQWQQKRYAKLPKDSAGLFIRCFHGSNTWEQTHFRRRMRNSFKKQLQYFYYKHIVSDISRNPLFQLSKPVREAFELYLAESRKLNLFTHDNA